MMTPTAYVFTIFFIHLGIVLVATSYFAFSAALAPRITHRARVRFAMRPWLPILIGVAISVPWVVISIVMLNSPLAGLKFAGAVTMSAWVLLGLIGGAGVAQHIGRPPHNGDVHSPAAWTDSIRGGLFITLTWVLPLIGWFAMLPLTLATGIGCLIMGAFPMKIQPQRHRDTEMMMAPIAA